MLVTCALSYLFVGAVIWMIAGRKLGESSLVAEVVISIAVIVGWPLVIAALLVIAFGAEPESWARPRKRRSF